MSTYRVGNDVTLELEFRTSSSTGVLLGISSQIMDGLGLELVNGRVRERGSGGEMEWERDEKRYKVIESIKCKGKLKDGRIKK